MTDTKKLIDEIMAGGHRMPQLSERIKIRDEHLAKQKNSSRAVSSKTETTGPEKEFEQNPHYRD